MLPTLADIFGVSIDALFGREPQEKTTSCDLPWEDDGKLHAVLFCGTHLVKKEELQEEKRTLTWEIPDDLHDVVSDFSISCRDITGSVRADLLACDAVQRETVHVGTLTCRQVEGTVYAGTVTADTIHVNDVTNVDKIECGTVYGDVVGETVFCKEINGNVKIQNGTLTCEGNIGGDLSVLSDIERTAEVSCGDVRGMVVVQYAKVSCGDIGGELTVGGKEGDRASVDASDVNGDVVVSHAAVSCRDIDGSLTVGGPRSDSASLSCADVAGDVTLAGGTLNCGSIGGDVKMG